MKTHWQHLALVVALAFGWYARRYPMQDHYRTSEP